METEKSLDPQEEAPLRPDDLALPVSYDSEVVIFSCEGRGNWLARELAARDWNVILVDLSRALEAGEPEDHEGPFGLFHSRELLPSQIERSTMLHPTQTEDDSVDRLCPGGFVLWLKSGPVEMTGPLADFHYRRLGLARACDEFFAFLPETPFSSRRLSRLRGKLQNMDFQKTWLVHLANQIASPYFVESHRLQARRHLGLPLELRTPLVIRRVTVAGREHDLEVCSRQGVKISRSEAIKEIRLRTDKSWLGSRQVVESVQLLETRLQAEAKTLKSRAYVWTLSSAESGRLDESFTGQLFRGWKARPTWYWTRLQILLSGTGPDWLTIQALPPFSLVIDEIDLPWTHANAFVLRRRLAISEQPSTEAEFDVWLRLPVLAATQLSYRRDMGQRIQSSLERRLPGFSVKILDRAANRQEVETIRYPLFDETHNLLPIDGRLRNFLHAGPETWPALDVTARMRAHAVVLDRLERMKADWLAVEAKLEAKRARRSRQ